MMSESVDNVENLSTTIVDNFFAVGFLINPPSYPHSMWITRWKNVQK